MFVNQLLSFFFFKTYQQRVYEQIFNLQFRYKEIIRKIILQHWYESELCITKINVTKITLKKYYIYKSKGAVLVKYDKKAECKNYGEREREVFFQTFIEYFVSESSTCK